MTNLPATAELAIPGSHVDLLSRPVYGVFTTIDAHGQPQSCLVWVDFDGAYAQINTTLEREKGRNMLVSPKVSLLVVDPDNTNRYLQIRGNAELVTEGAIEHLDALTRKYTRHPAYYGHIYPAAQRESETRVICRIHPRRITLDAIFSTADIQSRDPDVRNTARVAAREV